MALSISQKSLVAINSLVGVTLAATALYVTLQLAQVHSVLEDFLQLQEVSSAQLGPERSFTGVLQSYGGLRNFNGTFAEYLLQDGRRAYVTEEEGQCYSIIGEELDRKLETGLNPLIKFKGKPRYPVSIAGFDVQITECPTFSEK